MKGEREQNFCKVFLGECVVKAQLNAKTKNQWKQFSEKFKARVRVHKFKSNMQIIEITENEL